jgi:hypothetical protein
VTTAYDAAARRSLGPNYHKLWSSSAASNLADGVFLAPAHPRTHPPGE